MTDSRPTEGRLAELRRLWKKEFDRGDVTFVRNAPKPADEWKVYKFLTPPLRYDHA